MWHHEVGPLGYLQTFGTPVPTDVEIRLTVFSSEAGQPPCVVEVSFQIFETRVSIENIEGIPMGFAQVGLTRMLAFLIPRLIRQPPSGKTSAIYRSCLGGNLLWQNHKALHPFFPTRRGSLTTLASAHGRSSGRWTTTARNSKRQS